MSFESRFASPHRFVIVPTVRLKLQYLTAGSASIYVMLLLSAKCWTLSSCSFLYGSVADPVPFWPLVLGYGMGKKSGSGMNNPDHISESWETIFGLKYLNFLIRIRDGKKFGSWIRDKHIPDPRHCSLDNERCVAEEVLAKNIDYRQQVIRDLLEKEQEFVSDLRHHVPFIN
jgi:hypothetical protein